MSLENGTLSLCLSLPAYLMTWASQLHYVLQSDLECRNVIWHRNDFHWPQCIVHHLNFVKIRNKQKKFRPLCQGLDKQRTLKLHGFQLQVNNEPVSFFALNDETDLQK